MKITSEAAIAINLLMQLIARLQNELAPLDNACTVAIDALAEIRVGRISDETIKRLDTAAKSAAGLSGTMMAFRAFAPLCDLVAKELQR